MTGTPMSTSELMERLRRHYIAPGHLPGGVFVPECGWNGGSQRSRVDALYVGFTSTSGRTLIGHEVKTSRSDWRKELDTVGKADPWADECHAYYVVAPSIDIVSPEEVPDGWGLLVVNPRTKTRLHPVIKARAKPEGHTPSWNAVRSLIARNDTLMWQRISSIEHEAGSKVREQITKEVQQRERQFASSRVDHLESLVARLEEAIGCPITDYGRHNRDSTDAITVEQLAQAVKMIRAREPLFGRYRNVEQLADTLHRVQGELLALSLADAEAEAQAVNL